MELNDDVEMERNQKKDQGKTDSAFQGQVVESILGEHEFAINEKGVYLVDINENRIRPIMPVCAPLTIVAETRDVNGDNWGRILEFHDKDGNLQRYAMKMQDLRRDGDEVVDALLSKGLAIAPGKKPRLRLVEYIQNCQPENNARARTTDMTGWHGNQFILSSEIIGEGDERVIYQGQQREAKTYQQMGTLEEWRNNISRLCVGNSRLVLAVSAAFAAPLLRLIDMEGGGVHFVGNSSTGKSTALYVAASVMGSPEHYNQSWRATGNGLEGIAKFHNDTCLIIDEMGQVQAKEAGEISYMLANGAGKLRANIRGDARPKANWRLLFLSSGEVTLAEHMTEGGKKARAGMEVRLVDIQADAGRDMGIFEYLHGYQNGAEFSDQLKIWSTHYHGTPFREFIRHVIEDELAIAAVKETQEDFMDRRVPTEASGQVRRAATRFALIAAAGELATRYGITGWEEGAASNAAAICFESWLSLRGGTGNQETKRLLEQVKDFLEKHGDTRFVLVKFGRLKELVIADSKQKVLNRAGFRRKDEDATEFLVLPSAFHEMCEGFNIRTAAKILIDKGVLTPADDGKSQKIRRLPEMGPKRFYHINSSIWN